MSIRTRTGHWVNEQAIRNYYGSEADSAMAEGRAVIGRPTCPEGSIIRIGVSEYPGQYIIITPESALSPQAGSAGAQ